MKYILVYTWSAKASPTERWIWPSTHNSEAKLVFDLCLNSFLCFIVLFSCVPAVLHYSSLQVSEQSISRRSARAIDCIVWIKAWDTWTFVTMQRSRVFSIKPKCFPCKKIKIQNGCEWIRSSVFQRFSENNIRGKLRCECIVYLCTIEQEILRWHWLNSTDIGQLFKNSLRIKKCPGLKKLLVLSFGHVAQLVKRHLDMWSDDDGGAVWGCCCHLLSAVVQLTSP